MCAVLNPRQVTIELMVAEGDLVTMRGAVRGTQSGQLGDIPPSGKEVTLNYANVYRIRNRRIVEAWVSIGYALAAMKQLGMKLCPQDAPQ